MRVLLLVSVPFLAVVLGEREHGQPEPPLTGDAAEAAAAAAPPDVLPQPKMQPLVPEPMPPAAAYQAQPVTPPQAANLGDTPVGLSFTAQMQVLAAQMVALQQYVLGIGNAAAPAAAQSCNVSALPTMATGMDQSVSPNNPIGPDVPAVPAPSPVPACNGTSPTSQQDMQEPAGGIHRRRRANVAIRRGRGAAARLTRAIKQRRMARALRKLTSRGQSARLEWMCKVCRATNWRLVQVCRSCGERFPMCLPLHPSWQIPSWPCWRSWRQTQEALGALAARHYADVPAEHGGESAPSGTTPAAPSKPSIPPPPPAVAPAPRPPQPPVPMPPPKKQRTAETSWVQSEDPCASGSNSVPPHMQAKAAPMPPPAVPPPPPAAPMTGNSGFRSRSAERRSYYFGAATGWPAGTPMTPIKPKPSQATAPAQQSEGAVQACAGCQAASTQQCPAATHPEACDQSEYAHRNRSGLGQHIDDAHCDNAKEAVSAQEPGLRSFVPQPGYRALTEVYLQSPPKLREILCMLVFLTSALVLWLGYESLLSVSSCLVYLVCRCWVPSASWHLLALGTCVSCCYSLSCVLASAHVLNYAGLPSMSFLVLLQISQALRRFGCGDRHTSCFHGLVDALVPCLTTVHVSAKKCTLPCTSVLHLWACWNLCTSVVASHHLLPCCADLSLPSCVSCDHECPCDLFLCDRRPVVGLPEPWQSPMRGQRVGEASLPGPSSTFVVSPGRRIRGKRCVSLPCPETPPLHGDSPAETLLDVGTPTSAGMCDPCPSPPRANSSPTLASPAHDHEGYRPPDDEAPLQDDAASAARSTITVRLHDDNEILVRCLWVKSTRSWRWLGGPRKWNWTKDSRQGPKMGLSLWIAKYGHELEPQSFESIHAFLNCLPVDDLTVLSPPRALRQLRRATSGQQASVDAEAPAPVRPGVSLQVPDVGVCSDLMSIHCHEWLRAEIPTQRHLPQSMIERISLMLQQLWQISMDPQFEASQRFLAQLLLVLAPRWCWCEPPKTPGQALAPHSRPKLIKARLLLLESGAWRDLFLSMQLEAIITPVPTAAPPQQPGVLTPARIQAMERAVMSKTLGRSWQQLWSWGIPGSSVESATQIANVLNPRPLEGEPTSQPRPVVDEASILRRFSADVWSKTLRSFHGGKAVDVLGWSQATFASLASRNGVQIVLRSLVEGMLTASLHEDILSMLASARVIVLYKNGTRGLRPISVPTVFRKAAGTATCIMFRSDLKAAMPSYQYGCGQSHGNALLAAHISQVCSNHPSWTHTHIDIQHAFTAMHRNVVQQALRQVALDLETSQHHWTGVVQTAWLAEGGGVRSPLHLHQGKGQGDPLSSFAFALSLDEAVRHWLEVLQTHGLKLHEDFCLHAYVDDVVVSCDPKVLALMLETLSVSLGHIGLSMNHEKTCIFDPAQTFDPSTVPGLRASQVSCEGLLVCGTPLPLVAWQDSGDDSYIPVGSDDFCGSFLSQKKAMIARRLTTLSSLAAAMEAHAVFACYLVLRQSMLPCVTHLLRSLQVTLTLPWCRDLDVLFRETGTALLSLPVLSVEQKLILRLPLNYGGLGLLSLEGECPIHALSGALALRTFGDVSSNGELGSHESVGLLCPSTNVFQPLLGLLRLSLSNADVLELLRHFGELSMKVWSLQRQSAPLLPWQR